MNRVPPGPNTVRGIDISHYDGRVYFDKVKAANYHFVFNKCTEYVLDWSYRQNRAEARAHGLLFGAYHFFHPSRDPVMQAETFLKLSDLSKGDLLPVLDWEVTDDMPSMKDRLRAKSWLSYMEQKIGKTPIIYTGPYFAHALQLDAGFKHYPLWVAHYSTSAPLVPEPWDNWQFWQTSESARVPGIFGNCDINLFNGNLDELKEKYTL